jgi:hypothetical protein
LHNEGGLLLLFAGSIESVYRRRRSVLIDTTVVAVASAVIVARFVN